MEKDTKYILTKYGKTFTALHKSDMEKEKGINLKQFKKYLIKNYGEMCHDFCWSCVLCRTWRVFEDLEGFMENDEELNVCDMLPPPKEKH